MPLTSADIAIRLSTTAGVAGNSQAQADPNASLGKYLSTTALAAGLHTLFDTVSAAENLAGTVDFRCLFIANTHATDTYSDVVVWITQSMSGAILSVAVDDLPASALGSVAAQADQIASETTAPGAGVGAFGLHPTRATGLSIGSLGPQQCRAIWLRRQATASTTAQNNSATLQVDGLTPIALTVSGNEITDAVRAAGTSGDGLLNDSSFGIWEATTNLEASAGADVSAEGAGTGYTTGGTNTHVPSTEQFKFGAKSYKATYQDNALLQDIALTLTAAPQSASRWLYLPANYDGGGVRLQFANYAGATGTLFADANLGLRDAWQRVSVPNVTPAGGDLAGNVQVVNTGAAPTAGRFVYIDGCQTETKRIVTPFTLTTRGAARVRMPAALLDETQGWIACRLQAGASSALLTVPIVADWRDDDSNRIILFYNATAWIALRRQAGTGATASVGGTFGTGDVKVLIFARTATHVRLSIDGAAFNQASNTNIPTLSQTLVDIGSIGGAGQFFNANYHAVATGLGTLTDADAATLQTLLAADPTPDAIDAAIPTAQCTGVWTADTAVLDGAVATVASLLRWNVDGPMPPVSVALRTGESGTVSLRVGE